MPNYEMNDTALKACKFLMGKYGYVVVCILPHVKDKYPKGKSLSEYANFPLFGWNLSIFLQTRAPDFIAQCDALMQNKMLNSAASVPKEGSRFFRCHLQLDDDVPF